MPFLPVSHTPWLRLRFQPTITVVADQQYRGAEQKSAEQSGEDDYAPVRTDNVAGCRIEQRQFRAFLKGTAARLPSISA